VRIRSARRDQAHFLARGEKGGSAYTNFAWRHCRPVSRFDVANITNVRLTKDWKEYSIDSGE